MAYTIIRSDGTTLTTIQDGTVNTTSSSISLPGRNYAGYGQLLDTNMVRMLENWSSPNPPANPLRGQLWYSTNDNTLRLCPADGTTSAAAWITISTTGSAGTSTFSDVSVTGNVIVGVNLDVTSNITANLVTSVFANVTDTLYVANAVINSANIGGVETTDITAGSSSTPGNITGDWSVSGNINIPTGNVTPNAIYTDNYYYSNGSPFTGAGSYDNTDVFDYLTGSNAIPQFGGNIAPNKVTANVLAGGGVGGAGQVTGIWTLGAGARFQATYADLAERFEADDYYDAGTVVEIGGEKEITAVKSELSEEVFGVVSKTAAYLMNSEAGIDDTHPAIAVSGRVPVKVIGKVRKGQRLVSAGKGIARAAKQGEATAFNVIGRSLRNKTDDDLGTVEAIVIIK